MKTVLILLCLVWAITGCATQGSSTPPATYVLNTEVAPARAAQSSGKVLLVATPRAEPGFRGCAESVVGTRRATGLPAFEITTSSPC